MFGVQIQNINNVKDDIILNYYLRLFIDLYGTFFWSYDAE